MTGKSKIGAGLSPELAGIAYTSGMVITTPDLCESCGQEIAPFKPAKTLDESYSNDEQKRLSICEDCFKKRFKVTTKRSSGYGGTIYDLEERPAPRFGIGSKKLSCLKCTWVAWTEEGLAVHMNRRHKPQ
ncbi:MAG: hypothetical protein C4K47_04515 [Candidatus Thorarchaeota archaeon]|nr:MAG: hypothetical protein C4K47_04515 [Candidatus Thorarchaeota archaeon]